MLEQEHAFIDVVLLGSLGVDFAYVNDETLFNAENGVRGLVLVTSYV